VCPIGSFWSGPNRKCKRHFTPPLLPLASGPPPRAAVACTQRWRLPPHAAAACRGGAPQGVVRLSAAWTGRSGGGDAEDARVSRCEGLGTARREKLEGNDFKRDCTAAKGRMTPLRLVPRLWAHPGVGFVERTYLLAKAGQGNGRWNGSQLEGTQDTRDDRLLGDGSMMCSAPRQQNGQVSIARSNTRPSSLAQCHYGVPVFFSSPSTPCWRGVGIIASRPKRRLLARAEGCHGSGTLFQPPSSTLLANPPGTHGTSRAPYL
jgi:hypothetical protein